MKTKNFNCRGSRWNEILQEPNESMREAGYILIRRPVSESIMRRHGGSMATCIDVKICELPKSMQKIASQI